jgi:hypothetical protein
MLIEFTQSRVRECNKGLQICHNNFRKRFIAPKRQNTSQTGPLRGVAAISNQVRTTSPPLLFSLRFAWMRLGGAAKKSCWTDRGRMAT